MIAGLGGQLVALVFGFITRTFLVRLMSVEILGLNGLFSNLFTILSLANLGIGTAISYSLYKPIADDDNGKVAVIRRLLNRAFITIGVLITALGLGLIPFLGVLVKGGDSIDGLLVIYLMYLVGYVLPYFIGYGDRAVAAAHQRDYLFSTTYTLVVVAMDLAQVVVLLSTRDYSLYVGTQVVFTLVMYLVLRVRLHRVLPHLKVTKARGGIPREERQAIMKNIRGTALYNLGFVAKNGTDSLVVSSFLGVTVLGLVSNYQYIVGAVQLVLTQALASLVASIGNLNVKENQERKQQIFNVLLFASFWVFAFCSVCLIVLLDPFIAIWAGDKLLLPSPTTYVFMVMAMFLFGMQTAANSFRTAMGLFWYGRYRPIMSAVVNLVLAILLASIMGAAGVFLATCISILSVDAWWDPLVVYKYGFNTSLRPYFKKYLVYVAFCVVVAAATWAIAFVVPLSGLAGLVFRLGLCLVLVNGLFWIAFRKSEEFSYLRSVVLRMLSARAKRHPESAD